MLTIVVPGREFYDENTCEFVTTQSQVLHLEHSLISLSKWESKWKKPFLSDKKLTNGELRDYVRCMTLDKNVPDDVYRSLTRKNLEEVFGYVNDSKTATTFKKIPGKSSGPGRSQIITSEVVYYHMFSYGIPIECEKWHFSRLMTLIRVFSEKDAPKKKMTRKEILQQNTQLNALRRGASGSRG